jgi:glucosamine-6-phosphate deaminase
MNLLTTYAGSMMEGFLPRGWDLARIDACCGQPPGSIGERQPWWDARFEPVRCDSVADFDVMMGHEIATAIRRCREQGRLSALILPVGPMGMYRWAVYFLREWDVACDHVFGFNMDEWSDREGVTLPAEHPGAFQNAMESAFYGPLGVQTVPEPQRWFATADRLPHYAERSGEL